VDLGEFDPQFPKDFAQLVKTGKGFDFILIIHQKKAATAAFLEEDDPLAQVGGVLDDMGGRDFTLGMAGLDVFTLHIGFPQRPQPEMHSSPAFFTSPGRIGTLDMLS